jgi:hypothetical protein
MVDQSPHPSKGQAVPPLSNIIARIASTRDFYKIVLAGLICFGLLGYSRVFSFSQQLSLIVVSKPAPTCSPSNVFVPPRTHEAIILPRREQRGSWIGNTWIPPKGWKYYSVDELISFYGERSLLWVGDSTGFGASSTLYEILNRQTGSKYLQKNDFVKPHDNVSLSCPCDAFGHPRDVWPRSTCKKMPESSGPDHHFLFTRLNTLYQLESFLLDEISGKSNMTKSVDLFIVSLGVWEALRPKDCKDRSGKNRTTNALLNDTIALLEQFQSSKTLTVWRTSGHAHERNKTFINDFNEKAMDLIDNFSNNATSNLTFVDFGGAVLPRSFGVDLIRGDMFPHYGVEPRHATIQMITNQVAGMAAEMKRGIQEKNSESEHHGLVGPV